MDQIRGFLTQYSGPQAYAFFYLLIMSCGMGAPFNSDSCLIVASVLAALGIFNLKILMILAFFALLSGDSFTFFIGRKWGTGLIQRRPFRWIFKPEKIRLAENFLNTRGAKFLFVVRFLPLIRTALFFTAGSLQVRPRTFYAMNASSTAIYLPILMGSAFYASENIDQLIATLKRFQFGLLGLAVIATFFILIRKKNKKLNLA